MESLSGTSLPVTAMSSYSIAHHKVILAELRFFAVPVGGGRTAPETIHAGSLYVPKFKQLTHVTVCCGDKNQHKPIMSSYADPTVNSNVYHVSLCDDDSDYDCSVD